MGKLSLLSVRLCDIPMRLFCYMRDNPQMWKNRNEKINIYLSTTSRAKHKRGLAIIQRTL